MKIKVRFSAAESETSDFVETQQSLLCKLFNVDPFFGMDEFGGYLSSSEIDDADAEFLGSEFFDVVRSVVTRLDITASFLVPGYRGSVLVPTTFEGARVRGSTLRTMGISGTGRPVDLPHLSAQSALTVFTRMTSDPNVARMLDYLTRGNTETVWFDLWAVYDILRYDVMENGWIFAHATRVEIDNFEASANTFGLSRSKSRQQHESGTPRRGGTRISENEARTWITNLVFTALSELDKQVIRPASP